MAHRWMGAKLPSYGLLLAVVWSLASWPTLAGEVPSYRSLQMQRLQPQQARKQAEPGVRTSHVGWEVRSQHFVVVSTESGEQASRTAGDLEQAWVDMARLADRWTDVHRRPGFGQAAVEVLIASGNRAIVGGHGARPLRGDSGTALFVDLAKGPWSEGQLRREACGAFLRVAQQDALLPAWARLALAGYLAGDQPPKVAGTELAPPPTSRAAWTSEELQRAQLWGHFLLEGNDAQYAPRFLEAVRATLAARQRVMVSQSMHRPLGMAEPDRDGNSPLATLVAQAKAEGEVTAWLQDPAIGQPIVCPDPENLTLEARDQELVLILKLARRFAVAGTEASRPKHSEFSKDVAPASAEEPSSTSRPMWTMADLQRRLSAPGEPTWATLDVNGRLLFSDDHERLNALLAPADRRYATLRGEHGEEVLQATYSDGQVVQAWLEVNADNPRRPLVYFRRVAPTGSTADLRLEHILVR